MICVLVSRPTTAWLVVLCCNNNNNAADGHARNRLTMLCAALLPSVLCVQNKFSSKLRMNTLACNFAQHGHAGSEGQQRDCQSGAVLDIGAKSHSRHDFSNCLHEKYFPIAVLRRMCVISTYILKSQFIALMTFFFRRQLRGAQTSKNYAND